MVDGLGDTVVSYKIGLQLLPLGGAEFGQRLKAQGKNVFYDFKLHDIDATVEKATRSISTLGADFLTVHARPDVMAAAAKGKGNRGLKVLGVTVLTSLDQQALDDIGYYMSAEEIVMRRVAQAIEAGIDGVVSSPLEAREIRNQVPSDFLIVTPGVRLAGTDKGDQKRVSTPGDAIGAGASHIVVGRPITQADNPRVAAINITKNMQT